MKFSEIVHQSLAIRKAYHELEIKHHGSIWSLEEDALASVSDIGLVMRDLMAQRKRWPKDGAEEEIRHKLGEAIWWLIILSERQGIDIERALIDFLEKTSTSLGIDDKLQATASEQ